jgi:hypothetical protein
MKHCDQLAGAIENTYEAATGSDDTAATELAQKGTFPSAEDMAKLEGALGDAFTKLESDHGNANGKLDSAELAALMTHLDIPASISAEW